MTPKDFYMFALAFTVTGQGDYCVFKKSILVIALFTKENNP